MTSVNQCSKDGPDLLFGKLSIRDKRYEPFFTMKWIQFLNNNMWKQCSKNIIEEKEVN